jgi:23S rRNA (uracil1939-C5)-methyltransferase
VKLRVEKAVYGGAGLGHIPADASTPRPDEPVLAGKAVFVPFALPGELVEAHLADNRRSFATAELDAVLDPSPARVLPGCEYFPACGGCQYQHSSAKYQLQMKLDILRDTLARAHVTAPPGAIGALDAAPWGYRNRIRLHIGATGGSQPHGATEGFTLCYRERGSHRNLPVTHCPIAAPLIERAMSAVDEAGTVDEAGGASGLAARCAEIEFFTNAEQDALLLSLWTRQQTRQQTKKQTRQQIRRSRGNSQGDGELDDVPDFLERFSSRLKQQLPELNGIGIFAAGEGEDRVLGHWGRQSLLYSVAGREYQVSLGSFFQVNHFLIPPLVDLVTSNGCGGHRSGPVAWDLYAGVGLFSLALGFENVTAVESAPSSFADLKRNLAGTPHRAVRSTTLDFLRAENRRKPRQRPDLIVLDPPRAGLGKEVCAQLADVAAPAIVYVSCDPATLARDLQALLQSGYRIGALHVVDLFPQTYHLETVAVLAQA